MEKLTRRQFLELQIAAVSTIILAACSSKKKDISITYEPEIEIIFSEDFDHVTPVSENMIQAQDIFMAPLPSKIKQLIIAFSNIESLDNNKYKYHWIVGFEDNNGNQIPFETGGTEINTQNLTPEEINDAFSRAVSVDYITLMQIHPHIYDHSLKQTESDAAIEKAFDFTVNNGNVVNVFMDLKRLFNQPV